MAKFYTYCKHIGRIAPVCRIENRQDPNNATSSKPRRPGKRKYYTNTQSSNTSTAPTGETREKHTESGFKDCQIGRLFLRKGQAGQTAL